MHDVEAPLAEGRHAQALEAVRRARGGGPFLAIAESEALFGLLRYGEALGVATRALARGPGDDDSETRLRLIRARALWHTGRVAPARGEARRAAAKAMLPLTRARAFETLGVFAWKDEQSSLAWSHVNRARELYEAHASASGLARTLGTAGGLVKDAGRLDEALRIQSRRLELAAGTPRLDAVAQARADRGAALTTLGRWAEAHRELERAVELFAQVGDPRSATVAGRFLAALELAAGDIPRARTLLARAREEEPVEGGDPRSRAETLLVLSDLDLAAGMPEAAETAAANALGLFGLVDDPSGNCRSRVRRAQALLALGHISAAIREARRAVSLAATLRPSLAAMAQLVLGRALLLTLRPEAEAAFERVLSRGEADPGLLRAARVGRALARDPRDAAELRAAFEGLEAWGDRRLLAFAWADVRSVAGSPFAPPVAAPPPRAVAPEERHRDSDRTTTLRALGRVLGFCRAAMVGPAGELLHGSHVTPVPSDDLACALAGAGEGPLVVDLRGDPWCNHPTRVLHRLGCAAVVPAGPGLVLYADRREGDPVFAESELSLLAQVGRLLADRCPEPPVVEAPGLGFPGIIGRSPAMRALFARLERAAASDFDVHVCGETGTGKEKVARVLHDRSSRRRGPFVAINASSLNDELFESEMFGHTKGAFTGAVAVRAGHVAEADEGTLFLDEVTELSPRAQAKLLRFLQEREYRRLGETALRRANLRVVSAANVDLEGEVAAGRFRRDLLYRLCALKLVLPPLRDRDDDVVLLARHFLAAAFRLAGLPPKPLPADVLAALRAHSWPGNVRELEHHINQLVVLSGDGPLRAEGLSPSVPPRPPRGTLREAERGFQREHVRRALERSAGNRTHAAAELGVSRQALLGMIRRLGV